MIDIGGDNIDFEAASEENKNVTLGIIHDDYKRKKGVVLTSGESVNFKDENGDQNILQFYLRMMSRQLRGYPLAYKIIAAAKNNDRWWDATLARAVMETMIFGSVDNDTDDFRAQAESLADSMRDENGKQPTAGLSADTNAALAAPGTVFQSKTGGIKFSDLKTPSNNFDKMHNAHIEIVGMAMDMGPGVVKSNYPTSYTSHKGEFNDFIKSYEMKRNFFCGDICNPVVIEVAKYLFLENLIEMPHPDFFKNAIIQHATIAGNWLGPVPRHIDPKKEVEAKILSKDNAFSLPSDYAAENGYEFADFIEQWHSEIEDWRKSSPEQQAADMQKDLEEKENEDDEIYENENEENEEQEAEE